MIVCVKPVELKEYRAPIVVLATTFMNSEVLFGAMIA
jgi:hypothetical protein